MKQGVWLELEEYEALKKENEELKKLRDEGKQVIEIRDYYIWYWQGPHIDFKEKIFTFKGKKEFEEIVNAINDNISTNISDRINTEAFKKLSSIEDKFWYKLFGKRKKND